MASDRLAASSTVGDPASATLDRYLAELAARLCGPRRTRAAVLAEIRDGLDEAMANNVARGMPPAVAAANAVSEFGPPMAVAEAFAGELATAYARRTISAFILTGPLVGVWWLLLLGPKPWRFDLLAVVTAIPALPLIAVAVGTALVTYATTGRLIRWLPETTPARALVAASAVAALCLAGDLTVLTVLAARAVTAPGTVPPVLAAVAATASLIRVPASSRTIWHGRHTRNALPESH